MKSPLMTRCARSALISIGVFLCITGRTAPPVLRLEIPPPTSANEFSRNASFLWDAQRDLPYKVQSTATLRSSDWRTEDIVVSATNGPIRWTAPETLRTAMYYRLLLPQPQIFSVEPTFIDSSDPSALLYILGQLLPTNGLVMINGHVLTPTIINSNGVWAAVSLNGLPPGEPVIGTLTVMDSGSNVVATLPVQGPILYGTELTAEQLQGPAEDPPAVVKTKTKSNQSNDRVGRPKIKYKGSGGRVQGTLGQKAKAWMVSNFATESEGWRLDPVDFTTGEAFFRSASGLKSETEVFEYQEGGDNDGVRLAPGAVPRAGGLLQSIAPASGEVRCEETDLTIPGPGFDFAWTRTYRSRTGPTMGLGHGWDFSYNMRLSLQSDGTVQFCSGNGRCDTFYPNGTNGWARDEFFMTIGDLNKDGIPDVVICANGTRVNFNPIAMDKPVSITDRNNNSISFYYDGLGRLTTIVDTLGRSNVVSYNSSGFIGSITDSSTRTVRYEYDSNGDLIRCVSPAVTGTPNGNDFPGGKTNSYAYSSGFADERLNHNLLSCTDAKGQTWLQIVYQTNQNPASLDFDAVAYMQRGNDRNDIWRGPVAPSPTNGFAKVQVIMRDAVGNVTESFYDSRQRCVLEREYTGRASTVAPTTPTNNRPKGKLRADDPDYFETQWQWNNDSLCTLKISNATALGDGNGRMNKIRMTYAYDFDPNVSPLKKGDLMVLREFACCDGGDLDGDGTSDITERAWHFQYDPNFGSGGAVCVLGCPDKVVYDFRAASSTATWRKGWDGTIKGLIVPEPNGVAINVKGTGADKGRVAGVPLANGVAINVKGTGADKGRVAGVPLGNGVAINVKGTGADKNRFANGPRQTTSMDGTFESHPSGRILNYGAVRSTVQDFEKNTERLFKGEVCDDGNNRDEFSDSFVTYMIDPRGTTATQVHDNHGNPITQSVGFNGGNGVEVRATTSRRYNARGQMTAVTNAPDANGYTRVDTFDYYTNGPQAGYCRQFIVDAAGPTLIAWNLEYDSRGNLTRCVDPRTNDWLLTWNQLDQLVARQTPDRGFGTRTATTYSYDANNNVQSAVVELRDENDNLQYGHAIAIGHDFSDRITSMVTQIAPNRFATNLFEYDGNDDLVAVYSPMAVSGLDPHNYITYQYDERRFLWKQVSGPFSFSQCTTEYSYDGQGQLKAISGGTEDPTPATFSFAYDGFNRCVGITDPMSNVVTYAYDRCDNLVLARAYCEMNDVPGNAGNLRYAEWRWTFDGRARCIQSRGSFFNPTTQTPIGDGASVTTYSYATNGACISVTDDNGHVSRFSYDTVGRLASVTDPKTNSTSLTYDPVGNIIATTQSDRSDLTPGPQVFTTSCAYDALNRCVRLVDNVGNTNRYFYDSLSRVVRTVDPKGNNTFNSWDDLGHRTLVVVDMNSDGISDLASDANQSWSYDDNSRCFATTDDNTNTTSYVYDSRDRLVSSTEADGTACSLIWSPRSNLLRQQDASGTVVSNTFDALGRCISREITPGAGVATTTTFERYSYDGLSRLVVASNDISLVVIGYDSFGNPDSVTENGLQVHYTYDGVGNRTSITYPSGTAVGYTFDACDQVSQITRCEGCGNPWLGNLVATYAYDGAGRVGRITGGNGINTRVNWDGISGTANPPGDFGWHQVNGVNHQVGNGGTIIDRRMFAYDRNQNKVLRAQVQPFNQLVPPSTNQFGYDALNRLVAFTRESGTVNDIFKSYMLDGNANRLAAFSNGLVQPYFMDNTPPPGAADFQMNQYTATPFANQTFDENGNLNSRVSTAGQLQYQYDYANRLVAVNDLSGGFPAPITTFGYDALGRRISKTVHPQGLPPVTTEFVYDGPDDGSDCDDNDPKVIETRVSGIVGKAFILDGSRSTDDEVVRLVSGQPQYFHHDELGNVLALTDASGNVIERYDYDDFGAPIFLTSDGLPAGTNGSPADNSVLFHGMDWNSEVSLYFAHSKGAFDSSSGRYLLRAGVPLRFAAATSFAGNNPWSLKKEEGGRHTPFHNKYRPEGSSAGLSREILKTFFEKGDKPTQALTREVLKTFFEKGDKPTQAQTREKLKTYFETGDVPTQQQ